jgi:hypothetical protein
MAAHIAQEALTNALPSHNCFECDKHAQRKGWVNCRGNAALNGPDAATEFVRRLRAPFRVQLLNGRP